MRNSPKIWALQSKNGLEEKEKNAVHLNNTFLFDKQWKTKKSLT